MTSVTQVQLQLLTKIAQHISLIITPQNVLHLMELSIDQHPT